MSNRNVFSRFSFTVMATLLVAVSPVLYADVENRPDADDGWSQWTSLGQGYVARRKEPPKVKQLEAEAKKLARPENRLKTTAAKSNASVIEKTGKAGQSPLALWLRTGAEGLYRVSMDDLAAALEKSAKILRHKAMKGKFSLTNAGQPVPWYFDADEDELLFVGEAYDNFYTDENVYKFTDNGAQAMLMAVSEAAPIIGFGYEWPFREMLKFEEEPDYSFITWVVADQPAADYWFWERLFGVYKDLIDVELKAPDPAATGTAQIRVRLRGASNLYPGDDHHVYAELNGEPIGQAVNWDGFNEVILVADFDQSLLKPDGKNTLLLHSDYSLRTNSVQWLDDIELSYERAPIADNGSLWLHNTAAGVQTVTGFTDKNILVIESPVGTPVLRNDALIETDWNGGWTVTFETSADVDYLVAEREALQTPALVLAPRPRLKELNNRADYLVVAPREFEGTAKALATYRNRRFKYVNIVWLDEIYAEFSAGKVDPTAITRFMDWTKNWRTSPSYVTLIGKGTIDQKDRMGYGDSFLPVAMTSSPWGLAVSDQRLLAGDDEASFAIGRLPITTDIEGLAYIDKLINYESSIPGMERYEAVLFADNPDVAGDFHANSEALSQRLLDTNGFDRVTALYHPGDAVRDSMIDSATWETGYVSYDGHGSAAQVGDDLEKFISSADAALLGNYTYPLFTALTCASGDYSLPGVRSLAGALVLNPSGGAIASFAPTGLSLDADAQILGTAFVDSLFAGETTIGSAVRDAKERTAIHISTFMPPLYSVVGEPAIYARED